MAQNSGDGEVARLRQARAIIREINRQETERMGKARRQAARARVCRNRMQRIRKEFIRWSVSAVIAAYVTWLYWR